MTPLKITPLPGCTPGTAEKIDALNRKLGSFIHAPLNLKEVLRMEPFAADAEVVRAVAVSLDNYAILPTSTEECERQRTTGLPKDYDIVGFWYCVALLALSAEPEAVPYLLVAGAHTDGRGSRGTVPAAAHCPPAGGISIFPPAGTQKSD